MMCYVYDLSIYNLLCQAFAIHFVTQVLIKLSNLMDKELLIFKWLDSFVSKENSTSPVSNNCDNCAYLSLNHYEL